MNASRSYASEEAQSGFLVLPESDQNILKMIHESEAYAINDAINARVDSVMEVAFSPEALPYFELAGHRLERRNHGAPNCPDIALNEKKASRTKPQAWSKEIDGQEHWFYNYPGACTEAKFLGREVPTIDQWIEMLASVEGDAVQKAQTLNIPMAGSRYAVGEKFYNAGVFADVWSSSPKGDEQAHYASLGRGDAGASRYWSDREYGMSLRFLSDKK
jgi:hypothetical protein